MEQERLKGERVCNQVPADVWPAVMCTASRLPNAGLSYACALTTLRNILNAGQEVAADGGGGSKAEGIM